MKYLFIIVALLSSATLSHAQELYCKTYGHNKNQLVIFMHGGPGSSSIAFGVTTAQRLADNGFYVITYDRRGEGLSLSTNAQYTFQQTFDDLNQIYKKYGIQKAILIGFSFGGIVTTLYAEQYPEKIKSLILVSSLLSQPETYQTVLAKSKEIYQAQKDTLGLKDILSIENMDKHSFQYRAACFRHSSKNGFFNTKNQNAFAKSLYAKLATDTAYLKFSSQKNDDAVNGFWKNENYSTKSIIPILKKLQSNKMEIYALYGKDDGLFSKNQISELENITGKSRLRYYENCSHYLYTDQQDKFINALKNYATIKYYHSIDNLSLNNCKTQQ